MKLLQAGTLVQGMFQNSHFLIGNLKALLQLSAMFFKKKKDEIQVYRRRFGNASCAVKNGRNKLSENQLDCPNFGEREFL